MTDALEPLPLLHTRAYDVEAFALGHDAIRLIGRVRDTKPAGLMIADDPEPLDIHHMVVTLTVGYPDLAITDAQVEFHTHPHTTCPAIVEHYGALVGLSIARGFTHRVRELFGGPRGCTHTTALLQAMAPVAVQATWSMRTRAAAQRSDGPRNLTDEQRELMIRANGNTCHVWADDGEAVTALRSGGDIEVPVWIQRRLDELGRDVSDWHARRA
jgi:hypothetical protein